MPTIYLIRHAQASFGKSDYDRLSPKGEQQAVLLGKALAERVRSQRADHGQLQRARPPRRHRIALLQMRTVMRRNILITHVANTPLIVGTVPGVRAIEAEKATAYVPSWPWSPLARVMRFAPLPLLKGMM